MIRVAIYDDNPVRRDSLQTVLALQSDLECVGSYGHCGSILEDLKKARPDIILMDLEMPVVNGIEGIRLAKANFPEIKIIVQTAFDDDEKVFAALKAGAEGYILKSASVTQITQSIDEVSKGGASMSPSIAMKVIRYFGNDPGEKREDYQLTPKESMVLKKLADGLSYKMIADELGISYFTVNNHIKKIYEKLHVHSLGEAVAKAHRSKLI
ncbi:response regulator [Mariniradius sediminis]|jgi:DNA-binding NarL/FixJ family response regulator|uniref:Response regulator transcription factor n=1 Tax=Mariniradius sediminis TaxID=2909237 RepID=A0ABS9BVH3_9BACT|nr:response regulator transcription factor [Mariniradius sediminis]MCF1752064.1 response regulator transcription factor [Mariniradius sediminis]